MTTYAVTGAFGFLGWHLRCYLKANLPGAEIRALGRGDLDDERELAARLDGCDAVFHLAAVNSHDRDAAAANVGLAEALAAGLSQLREPPGAVIYSSSHHAAGDSPYGVAKRKAAEVLARSASRFVVVSLPNLFGEMGRPNYNSAVATFCDAIVNGRTCEVNAAGATELLHAHDACAALVAGLDPASPATSRIPGTPARIPDVYDSLARFHEAYRSTHVVPRLANLLEVRLFNQLRAAMFPGAYPVRLTDHADARGVFYEAVRGFGETQTAFSTTRPGVVRGEHWHADKIERFLVVRGTARIEIRRLFDDVVHTFDVTGDAPAFVDMPTLHAHNIVNVGDGELLTMFWANDHFRPDRPDTWPEPVRGAGARVAEALPCG